VHGQILLVLPEELHQKKNIYQNIINYPV